MKETSEITSPVLRTLEALEREAYLRLDAQRVLTYGDPATWGTQISTIATQLLEVQKELESLKITHKVDYERVRGSLVLPGSGLTFSEYLDLLTNRTGHSQKNYEALILKTLEKHGDDAEQATYMLKILSEKQAIPAKLVAKAKAFLKLGYRDLAWNTIRDLGTYYGFTWTPYAEGYTEACFVKLDQAKVAISLEDKSRSYDLIMTYSRVLLRKMVKTFEDPDLQVRDPEELRRSLEEAALAYLVSLWGPHASLLYQRYKELLS